MFISNKKTLAPSFIKSFTYLKTFISQLYIYAIVLKRSRQSGNLFTIHIDIDKNLELHSSLY